MFLWTNRQAVWFLLLLVFYVALLAHPKWRPGYERIAAVLFLILVIGTARFAMRK
jgi:hypothetical protein